MVKPVLYAVALAALGVVLGTVGTLAHRAVPPWAIVASIAMTFAGAIFARTWTSWIGLAALGTGWAVAVILLSQRGPGGSLLVVGDGYGNAWTWGGAAAIVAVALLPVTLLTGERRGA